MSHPPPDPAAVAEILAAADREARERARRILADELTAAYVDAARARLRGDVLAEVAPAPLARPAPVRAGAPTGRWLYAVTADALTADAATAGAVPANPVTADAATAGAVPANPVTADAALPAGLAGVDDAAVDVVSRGGLAAIVSPVDPERVAGFADADLSDGGALATAVRRHDAVVSAIFDRAGVLPFRFGTICRDEAAVVAFLETHGAALRAELDRLRGVGEWSVRVYRPAGEPAAEESIEAAGASGAAYLQARAQRQLAREERARFASEAAAELVETLVPLAEDWTPTRGRRADDGAEPIAAAAFLVARDAVERFAAATEQAARHATGRGLRLDASGPWPPYQFTKVRELADA